MNTPYLNMAFSFLTYCCLPLYEGDARAVENLWGWTRDDIEREGVRSTPSFIFKLFLLHEMEKRFDLSQIPGFYRKGQKWDLNVRRGLLKPYRDERGRILGLLVYRNPQDNDPRLLSSAGLPFGTRAVVHRRVA